MLKRFNDFCDGHSLAVIIILTVMILFRLVPYVYAQCIGNSGIGGSLANNPGTDIIYQAKSYGVKCDNVSDDSAALQSLITTVCATGVPHSRVQLPGTPGGSCVLAKPVIIPCQHFLLEGAGEWNTLINATGRAEFPINVEASSVGAFPTSAALVSGSAASYHGGGPLAFNWPFIELKDAGDFGNINGLAALTVEAFVKLNSTNPGVVVSSSGQHILSDPVTGAIELGINGAGHWQCIATTGGVQHTATAPGVAATGVTHWDACSYDGSNIRLYDAVPGTGGTAPVATTPANGTITQKIWESFTLGARKLTTWEANNSYPDIDGDQDSFRLSNTARGYTGTITAPTATLLADDGNNLALWTGATSNGGQIVIMRGKGGNMYMTPRDQTFQTIGASSDVWIKNLGIINGVASRAANGIYIRGCVDCGVENINLGGDNNWPSEGVYFYNNSFGDFVKNVRVNYFGWFGIANVLAGGYLHADGLFTQGGPGPGVIMSSGGSGVFNLWQHVGNSVSVGHGYFEGTPGADYDTVVLIGPSLDDENGTVGVFTEGIVDSNYNSLTIIGGIVEGTTGAVPIRFDSLGTNGHDPLGAVNLTNVEVERPPPFTGNVPLMDIVGTPPAEPITVTRMRSPNMFGYSTGIGNFPLAPFVSDANSRYFKWTDCSGLVTLAGGAGTFTNGCVFSSSDCHGVDITTRTNAVTLGNPAAGSPQGSVSITGTGTDVVKVTCQ